MQAVTLPMATYNRRWPLEKSASDDYIAHYETKFRYCRDNSHYSRGNGGLILVQYQEKPATGGFFCYMASLLSR